MLHPVLFIINLCPMSTLGGVKGQKLQQSWQQPQKIYIVSNITESTALYGEQLIANCKQ